MKFPEIDTKHVEFQAMVSSIAVMKGLECHFSNPYGLIIEKNKLFSTQQCLWIKRKDFEDTWIAFIYSSNETMLKIVKLFEEKTGLECEIIFKD